MRIGALALGLALASGACASSGTATTDQTPTQTSTARRTNIITTQEIRESKATTVGDLIRQSRPGWPRTVAVFLNNDPDPSGTVLNRSSSTVTEIRYFTKSEAQTKWGSRVEEVVQIITR